MKRKKLTKAEIVENLHEKTNADKKLIKTTLDNFFTIMKTALAEDNIIELRGFGTFEIRARKGRSRARNPRTGELAVVEDHGVPVFKPGKELRETAWPILNRKK